MDKKMTSPDPVPLRQVELLETNKPQQERAIKTYESILTAAGELLVEVGMDRISTNLIAEKAGITVPALYRYFPNKYAVLNALGARLTDAKNQAFIAWHQEFVAGMPPDSMLNNLESLLQATLDATNSVVGGPEIVRCMEALAPLRETRSKNHWALAEAFGQTWAEQWGVPFTEATAIRARIAVNLGFSAVQLALEDERADTTTLLHEGANALRCYLLYAAEQAGLETDLK